MRMVLESQGGTASKLAGYTGDPSNPLRAFRVQGRRATAGGLAAPGPAARPLRGFAIRRDRRGEPRPPFQPDQLRKEINRSHKKAQEAKKRGCRLCRPLCALCAFSRLLLSSHRRQPDAAGASSAGSAPAFTI
jgi:hypothetical protein